VGLGRHISKDAVFSRDGDGTCASGHLAGPPRISMHSVHWWSGSNALEVGGGMVGCGVMHGEGVGVAVGWCVGGVGRAKRALVNGSSLWALNAAVFFNGFCKTRSYTRVRGSGAPPYDF
jgi:hypothetical protein